LISFWLANPKTFSGGRPIGFVALGLTDRNIPSDVRDLNTVSNPELGYLFACLERRYPRPIASVHELSPYLCRSGRL
tara:strand:- start:244 stop:474 length:231 start_codon:yes stop_codon:yes gene_type:complete